MGVIGPVVCIGFGLGRTCVCILVEEVNFFFSLSDGQGYEGDVLWGCLCEVSLMIIGFVFLSFLLFG